jgi:predicted nucleic acid-binding protein
MARPVVLLDTSVLIEYFRKKDKAKTVLFEYMRSGIALKVSAVTEYELYAGVAEKHKAFWRELLAHVEVVPFASHHAHKAVELDLALKRDRKQLAIADLFIAATALGESLPIVTLNKRHFERVEGLNVR